MSLFAMRDSVYLIYDTTYTCYTVETKCFFLILQENEFGDLQFSFRNTCMKECPLHVSVIFTKFYKPVFSSSNSLQNPYKLL